MFLFSFRLSVSCGLAVRSSGSHTVGPPHRSHVLYVPVGCTQQLCSDLGACGSGAGVRGTRCGSLGARRVGGSMGYAPIWWAGRGWAQRGRPLDSRGATRATGGLVGRDGRRALGQVPVGLHLHGTRLSQTNDVLLRFRRRLAGSFPSPDPPPIYGSKSLCSPKKRISL